MKTIYEVIETLEAKGSGSKFKEDEFKRWWEHSSMGGQKSMLKQAGVKSLDMKKWNISDRSRIAKIYWKEFLGATDGIDVVDEDEVKRWWKSMKSYRQDAYSRLNKMSTTDLPSFNARDWGVVYDIYIRSVLGDSRGWERPERMFNFN